MKLEELVKFFTACGNTLGAEPGVGAALTHAMLAQFFSSAVSTINEAEEAKAHIEILELKIRSMVSQSQGSNDEVRGKNERILAEQSKMIEKLRGAQAVIARERDHLTIQQSEQAGHIERLKSSLEGAKKKYLDLVREKTTEIAAAQRKSDEEIKKLQETHDLQNTKNQKLLEERAKEISDLKQRLLTRRERTGAQNSTNPRANVFSTSPSGVSGGHQIVKAEETAESSVSAVSLGKRKAGDADRDLGESTVRASFEEEDDEEHCANPGIPDNQSETRTYAWRINSKPRRQTLDGLPIVIDVPGLEKIKVFTRKSLGDDLGGNPRSSLICGIKTQTGLSRKRKISCYLCPRLDQNPWSPAAPGESGYIFVGLGKDSIWIDQIPRSKAYPLFADVETGKFIYCGTYIAVKDHSLNREEWKSLPESTKINYCELTKIKGKHLPALELERLKNFHRATTSIQALTTDKSEFAVNATTNEIFDLYDEGVFVVPCVRLECVDFDWELYEGLNPVGYKSLIRNGRNSDLVVKPESKKFKFS